jgi:phosphatidylinositol-3-phosphatase
MHDGSVAQGDNWLRNNLDAYAQWTLSHNALLIITFDESGDKGLVPTIFYGPMVKQGVYSQLISHYSVLRTLEELYGLPFLGGAATVASIANIWLDPMITSTQSKSPSVTPTLLSPTTSATFSSTASVTKT